MENVTALTGATLARSDSTHTSQTNMSQRRNTPTSPSRRRYTGAFALAIAGLAACSADREALPTAPVAAAPNAAAFGKGPDDKAVTDAAKRLTDAALTVLAPTWHTTSADVEAPTTKPLDLSCPGFSGVYMVSQRVGKSGGTLKFGKSELKIPSGALSADTQISATITFGAGVDVDFQPHGLQFAKAAELKVDWTGCTAPAGSPINMYYTDAAGYITQVMPSAKSSATQSRMLTDHFSGFTVSWGRR